MKKIIITFILLCSMGNIMAQSYTESFNEVFRHVDLSHTSTGTLSERGLPPEDLPTNFSWVNNKVVSETDTADTQNYKHSVGVSAFCSFVGVSLKYNLEKKLYIQADLGGNAYLNFLGIPISSSLGADFGVQVYILYEDLFPKRTNTYWIAGFGLNFGCVPHFPYSKQASLKGGAKAIFGIEYIPDNARVSFQVDTRWGYGMIYSTEGVRPWERNGFISDDNPYHILDYGIVFSLRYHFGKKN